jgi:hypothetical protein
MFVTVRPQPLDGTRHEPRGANFARRRLHRFMHGPIPAITTVTAVFGYAIAHIATEPINPGHPSFPMILAFLGASIGATWELIASVARQSTQDLSARARDRAFWFSLAAGWIGTIVYVACLLAVGF